MTFAATACPSPPAGMTKRRFVGTLVACVLMFLVIGTGGQFWILQSEPYELGRAAVGSRLGVAPDAVKLNRLASFRFSDGRFSGEADVLSPGFRGPSRRRSFLR
jgi:hypothetical protein